MTVTQRLFGVKCAGSFAGVNSTVTAPDGTINITSIDQTSFVNGVNNVQALGDGGLAINYTLFTIGTAGAPAPPTSFTPDYIWLGIP